MYKRKLIHVIHHVCCLIKFLINVGLSSILEWYPADYIVFVCQLKGKEDALLNDCQCPSHSDEVCICVYVCVCVCIYISICIFLFYNSHVYIYLYVYVYICIYVYMKMLVEDTPNSMRWVVDL